MPTRMAEYPGLRPATTILPKIEPAAPTLLNVQLHTGKSGLVQVGMEPGGELVAVKLMESSYLCKNAKQVMREINNHQHLSVYKHPFIMELKRVCLITNHLALVMEQFQGSYAPVLNFLLMSTHVTLLSSPQASALRSCW